MMENNNRYYQRDFEELYYVIDSNVISEKDFDEKVMYEGYNAFEDALTGEEIINLLNENEKLKTLNTHLKNEMSWIKDCAYWREKEAFNKLFGNYMVTVDEYRIMLKENQYLKELLMDCCEVSECEIEDEIRRRKSE